MLGVEFILWCAHYYSRLLAHAVPEIFLQNALLYTFFSCNAFYQALDLVLHLFDSWCRVWSSSSDVHITTVDCWPMPYLKCSGRMLFSILFSGILFQCILPNSWFSFTFIWQLMPGLEFIQWYGHFTTEYCWPMPYLKCSGRMLFSILFSEIIFQCILPNSWFRKWHVILLNCLAVLALLLLLSFLLLLVAIVTAVACIPAIAGIPGFHLVPNVSRLMESLLLLPSLMLLALLLLLSFLMLLALQLPASLQILVL